MGQNTNIGINNADTANGNPASVILNIPENIPFSYTGTVKLINTTNTDTNVYLYPVQAIESVNGYNYPSYNNSNAPWFNIPNLTNPFTIPANQNLLISYTVNGPQLTAGDYIYGIAVENTPSNPIIGSPPAFGATVNVRGVLPVFIDVGTDQNYSLNVTNPQIVSSSSYPSFKLNIVNMGNRILPSSILPIIYVTVNNFTKSQKLSSPLPFDSGFTQVLTFAASSFKPAKGQTYQMHVDLVWPSNFKATQSWDFSILAT